MPSIRGWIGRAGRVRTAPPPRPGGRSGSACTAASPPPRGEVIYYPGAFTAAGRAAIHERVTPSERIEIGIDDACRLAANAVCLGNSLVMSDASESLRAELKERGYRMMSVPLPSF